MGQEMRPAGTERPLLITFLQRRGTHGGTHRTDALSVYFK